MSGRSCIVNELNSLKRNLESASQNFTPKLLYGWPVSPVTKSHIIPSSSRFGAVCPTTALISTCYLIHIGSVYTLRQRENILILGWPCKDGYTCKHEEEFSGFTKEACSFSSLFSKERLSATPGGLRSIGLRHKQIRWLIRNTKDAAFWNVTPCGSCKNRRFRRTYRDHHRGNKNRRARNVNSN
jgi:hypothetical protein